MESSRSRELSTVAAEQRRSQEKGGTVPYCAVCGQDSRIHGTPVHRFGETLCSEAHAKAFVAAVQADRTRRAAGNSSLTPPDAGGASASCAVAGTGSSGWKRWALHALCWGAPLVALLLLFGGAASLLGAAEAALPYLALLACPLAMILMMRAMGSTHQMRSEDSQPVAGPRPEPEQPNGTKPVQAERTP